jgi:hypothetical protein
MSEMDVDALRDELAEFAEPIPEASRSAVEARVLAGFEEIQRWVAAHGRLPQNEEGLHIFERLYAVRLDRLRTQPDLRVLLGPVDKDGILAGTGQSVDDPSALTADDLAAELAGIETSASDLTELRHVRPRSEIRAAEEIASRQPCADFETFRPLFNVIQDQIRSGSRQTGRFATTSNHVHVGDFFILGGQLVFIADMEPVTSTPEGPNARLRAIFANGTESNLLLRSLQNALYKDDAGRRVTEPDDGPLFAAEALEGEMASGTVYVLRSKSDLPAIATYRDLIHKIGVTGGDVQRRIANAKFDATFLLADVEVVTTYQLYHIDRNKLENLLHRFFAPGRLDITITDRFGNPVSPREWFQVPLFVIDEAIEHIRAGSITDYRYDPTRGALVRHDATLATPVCKKSGLGESR